MNTVNSDLLMRSHPGIAMRILIVDDDQNTREILAEALRLFGAEARCVGSAAAALASLSDWQPDLLISDLGMPLQDGYDLIRAIRALAPAPGADIPALALTGYVGIRDQKRALLAGFNEVLTKPADLDELLGAIRRVAAAARLPD